MTRPWPKVKWTRAGQVASLAGDNVNLADMMELAPADAFARLRADDDVAATHFIAQCLPRLDAVRWLANCLLGMTATNQARRLAARKAVNRWLAEPSDANRRLAYDAGDAAGFDTAEGCACLAVFFSGGSMAPPTQEQPVPPPPAAFGQALAGAVILAALNDEPVNMAGRLATSLDAAELLAAGSGGAA
ncbi:MAG: DUF6931 family protein [Sandarakinorhabdus sp.]|jgi:hypothetical protein